MVLLAVSCKKDNKPDNDDPVKYGVDGVTPMPDAVDILSFDSDSSDPDGFHRYCGLPIRPVCEE